MACLTPTEAECCAQTAKHRTTRDYMNVNAASHVLLLIARAASPEAENLSLFVARGAATRSNCILGRRWPSSHLPPFPDLENAEDCCGDSSTRSDPPIRPNPTTLATYHSGRKCKDRLDMNLFSTAVSSPVFGTNYSTSNLSVLSRKRDCTSNSRTPVPFWGQTTYI